MIPSSARVASKWLAARFDLKPYAYADLSMQEVVDRRLHAEPYNPNPDLDEDMAHNVSGRAGMLNRARAWPLDDFIKWMEDLSGADRIDALRKVVDEDPLLILIKNPRGKVVDTRTGDEDDLRKIREMAASPSYSDVRGMTIEAGPLSKTPLVKKLRELEATREQRYRDYAKLYADLREIHPDMQYGRNTADEVTIHVEDHGVVVGGMQATTIEHIASSCADDLAKLTGVYGPGPTWMVWHAALHPYLRNHHVGLKMYEMLIDEVARKTKPSYLVANRCLTIGDGLTSDDAKRVWQSLSRTHPSSGLTLAIL